MKLKNLENFGKKTLFVFDNQYSFGILNWKKNVRRCAEET